MSTTALVRRQFKDKSITYDKIQDTLSASQALLGRYTNSAGTLQEIILGTGLTLNSSTGILSSSIGTLTSISVITANGFSGSIANPTTTPAITLSTTITGLLKGDGTSILSAVANTDYVSPSYTGFDSRYLQLSGGSMTGFLTLAGDPTNSNHAVNKNYVDNIVTGLSWKNAVLAATTTNITLSGTQSVDGVILNIGDRVLVKNQTTASQNGIYVVANGSWTRAVDEDNSPEVFGSAVYVSGGGTLNKNTQWTNSNSTAPTIGTDPITYVQISGAGTYTNGTGISLIGNAFSLDSSYTDTLYIPLSRSLTINGNTQTLAANRTFTITTTGTPNRISVSGGGTITPTIDIDSAYLGQTSITTLGTINFGNWQASPISVTRGGTGQVTALAGFNALSPMVNAGDIIYGGTSGSALRLAAGTTTQVLIGGSTPSWGSVNLSSMASGTLQASQFPALSGEVTTSAGSLNVTINNSAVIGKTLSGFIQTTGAVGVSDTILTAIEKIYGNSLTVVDSTRFVVRETPSGTTDGVNTVFILANIPISNKESVYLNGLLLDSGLGNDYTLSSKTLTFLSGAIPMAGDKIRVSYIY
jgi:hypothetical protein